jgi:hypothetical protein
MKQKENKVYALITELIDSLSIIQGFQIKLLISSIDLYLSIQLDSIIKSSILLMPILILLNLKMELKLNLKKRNQMNKFKRKIKQQQMKI